MDPFTVAANAACAYADKAHVERSATPPINRAGWRVPAVASAGAAAAIAVVLVKHSLHDITLGLALIAALVPITLTDLERRIIPNKITLRAAIAAVAIGLLTRPSGVPEQLIAGAAAGAFLLVLAIVHPSGMGMGDVKLAGVLGLFLGRTVAVAIAVGVFGVALAGIAILIRKGIAKGRKTGVPFAPFLAIGAVVALLAGPALLHAYLHSAHP
jgi:leader peptidase (prepilin peptidase)/N-methyltransferase